MMAVEPKSSLRGFLAETRGAAAAEFVLWLAVLTVPLLSAVDVGVYAFQRMQTQIAAQAAVQYVWQKCDPNLGGVPAFSKCSDLSLAKITSAAQSTSLGTNVTVSSAKEGTACPASGGVPVWVGTPSIAIGTAPTPGACPLGSAKPDYVTVTVSYPYTPVFTGLSIGVLLTTPITQTAWMRMN